MAKEQNDQDPSAEAGPLAVVKNDNDQPTESNETDVVELGDEANDGENQEEQDQDGTNGGFQNSNFQGQGDLNQMQMMMAMQNGMAPNSFGGFPMMGMYWQISLLSPILYVYRH